MRMMTVHGFAAAALGAALAVGLGAHAQAAAPANYSRACMEIVASNGFAASNSFVEKAVYGTARRSVRRTARRTVRRHSY
jgi:F0F1-type ATP synthase membrane subunit c/vacuolar-type H+-ATPase subunit K